MLARYLREQTRPVRYAMDPAHLQAIQNYLLMATRGHGIPRLHAGSMDQLGPVYQQAPHAQGAMQSLLQSGHPADLMAYLDSLQDVGFQPNPMQGDSYRLLDTLSALHGHLSGDPIISRILRGFTSERINDPGTRGMMGRALQQPLQGGPRTHMQVLNGLYNMLGAHPDSMPGRPLAHLWDQLLNPMQHVRSANDPAGLVPLHDTAREIARSTVPGNVGSPYHAARDAAISSEELLRDHAIPHLIHLGGI